MRPEPERFVLRNSHPYVDGYLAGLAAVEELVERLVRRGL
jgi:hypothetical protein